jgi:hypothetical protein
MNQLSNYIGKSVLKRRSKKVDRDKSVQNFETAHQAVILFDTSLPNCFPPIKEFTKFLKKQGIKTSVFGYVGEKETPQEMLLWADFEFITRKDINWYGGPKGEKAELYFSKKTDMLFVISFEKNLTIEYLSQLSTAKFKIGCYAEEDLCDLDLMINPANKACEVGYFIEQVKHYIALLHPSN